jgi:uncharacterized membrane protein YqaE (UPF0057 family)
MMRKTILLFTAVLLTVSSLMSPAVAASSLPVASSSTTEPDPAAIKAAKEEFLSLSRKEKKARIKEVKKEIKAYKKAKRAGAEPSDDTVLLAILAILLPPLAVYLHQGEINNKFWISLLLTLLFWLPGVIYAFIVIFGKG